MKRLFLCLGIAGLFIGALFFGWTFRFRNATSVELDLIWIRFGDVELWWVILVAIGLGAGVSTLLVGFIWLRGRLLNHRYRRAIKRLESELHEMRSLPLVGSSPEVPGGSIEMPATEQA